VLVVVEDRDVDLLAQALLDGETLGRFDVLEIDATEGGFHHLDGLDEFVGIGFVEFDVEDVDVGEALEQDALPFHDRFRRLRADVAQSEHGGAVRDDADEIALGRVLVRVGFVRVDLETRRGDARRVREREIALRIRRFRGRNLYFSGWIGAVILQ